MKNRIYLLFCITLLTIGSYADAQRVLSLDSCYTLALKNNKSLLISKDNVALKHFDHLSAKTNYFPKISLMSSYIHSDRELSLLGEQQKQLLNHIGTNTANDIMNTFGPIAIGIIQKDPSLAPLLMGINDKFQQLSGKMNQIGKNITNAFRTDTRNVSISTVLLTQPLYMGGKITAYNSITKSLESIAKNQLELDRQNVLLETDKAYWQLVSLYHKYKLAVSYKDMLDRLQSDVNKMIEAGVATKSNALQIAVKVNEAEMLVTKVHNGMELSKMLLCHVCGLPLNSNIALIDYKKEDLMVKMDNPEVNLSMAYINRPEFAQLKSSINIYDQKVKIAKSNYLPHIALLGDYTMMNPSAFNGFQKKFNGIWHIGITFKMPIWNWGESKYKIRAAKAEAQMNKYKADDVKEKIELQVNQAALQVQETNKRIKMALKNQEKAEENLRMARLGFKEGVINTTDVLAAETAWLQAKSEKIDAQIDGMISRTNLKKALGILSPRIYVK